MKYEYKIWNRHKQSEKEKADTRTIVEIINDNAKEDWEHYLIDGSTHYFRRELKKTKSVAKSFQ